MMLKNVFALSFLATVVSHASGKVLRSHPPNAHEIHRRTLKNETEGGEKGTMTKVYIENASTDREIYVYAYLPLQWGWTYLLEEGEKHKIGETMANTLTWRAWVFNPNSTLEGFISVLGCGETDAGRNNTLLCQTDFSADDGGSYTLVLDDAMIAEAMGDN